MHAVVKFLKRLFGQSTEVDVIVHEEKVEAYVLSGLQFGDVVSMIYMGECIGFEELLKKWERAEKDYAELGYRTLTLDDFVDAGGWGRELTGLRVPRDVDEPIVLHAAYYRKYYLGRVGPAVDFERVLQGEVQSSTYARPTTAHLKVK